MGDTAAVRVPSEEDEPSSPPSSSPILREEEEPSRDLGKQVRIEMGNLPRHKEDDMMSKTTVGSQAGNKRKARHFNINNLNRYGTIESTYLCELDRESRIAATERYIEQRGDIHFITHSEVSSFKKALRIQITEDYDGVPEVIGKVLMKECYHYIPCPGFGREPGQEICCCGRDREVPSHKVITWQLL